MRNEVSLSHAPHGSILAEDVYSEVGLLLLPKGTPVNPRVVEYLMRWNIEKVTVAHERGSVSERPDAKFESTYRKAANSVRQILDGIRYGNAVPVSDAIPEISALLVELSQQTRVLTQLHLLRQEDSYTFNHCINVGVVSVLLARWMRLPVQVIPRLGIAATFHDIGKSKVPLDILNKPGSLTDEEFAYIRRHPITGHEILMHDLAGEPDLADLIAPALCHHEREDGSGYPHGLKGDSIHLWAKIVAVADVYDAMTSNRVYRPRFSHFVVVDRIMAESFSKLDPSATRIFLDNVAHFGIGQTVLLSDGRTAKVILIDQTAPTRPLVEILGGGSPEFINLATATDLRIDDLIQDESNPSLD